VSTDSTIVCDGIRDLCNGLVTNGGQSYTLATATAKTHREQDSMQTPQPHGTTAVLGFLPRYAPARNPIEAV
jgi:hypothetical protein